MSKANSTKRYQKKDQISHCLDRPDMYVGSTSLRKIDEYVAEIIDENNYNIYLKNIESSPAILRIFIEALSNSIDNVERSKFTDTPCTTIKININKETGETSIWNDGDVVPIEIHDEEKVYNHTMIFGQLLTGSNYDDEEERIVAGRNGIGGKAVNIFSNKFTVSGCDPIRKKTFSQTWTNNMRNVEEPIVGKSKSKDKGFTQVSWIPDFKQFNLTNYTDDIISLYTKNVIDASMLSKVKVYLNDNLLNIKNLSQYSQLYKVPTEDKLYIKTETCEVVVTPCENGYEYISFVNGIYTRLGGQHVESWSEAIFRPVVEKFNVKSKNSKTSKINITDVKQFFRIFVVATVIRPEFNGQNKDKLEAPSVPTSIKTSHINAICKWSVMDNIEDIIKSKELVGLKKSERKKKNIKIEGLDPANNAGTKHSSDCCLFICEGLSAKTYVVSGIDTGVYGKKGRDWFGILPVSGKCLNVRNATSSSISENKVIISFIQSTGLRYGIDYKEDENYKSLYYGKVISITDADNDGIHIESLLMNIIHYLFPTLLDRKEPYFVSMKTPIARVFIPKSKDLLFYDENNFNKYVSEQNKKLNVKYYKGLGTTREEDVPDTFGIKMVEYKNDKDSTSTMNKVFNKKYANDRKTWLENYNPSENSFSLDDQKETICNMNISDFLNNETIKFSYADCARSIPNCVDGLKESQRKILYAVRKRNLRYSGTSLKVAQLSGYVAEHSNYHHGEQNLQETIINMASGFVGTNNIPLLYPDGGFGSRLAGGDDAANARYIFTKMEEMTEYIFRSEDDPLLKYVNDDGDLVQPEYYVPIIPMILVNGAIGIGTGWSCNIPCYNPKDLVSCIKKWIENNGKNDVVQDLPNLIPWYRGFKGVIKNDDTNDNRFITEGIIKETKKDVKEINELPIGVWTNKYKEFIEDLVCEKQIKNMKNYSTTNDVKFVLNEHSDGLLCNVKNLKLQTYLYTSNMVLFTEKNRIMKYNNISEIIDNFCKVRLDFYIKRKIYQLKKLEFEIKHLSNKERFIQEVIDKTLLIMNETEDVINNTLKERKYDEEPEVGGYDYLLRLQIRTFTLDKIIQLKNDIKNISIKIDKLKSTEPQNIWLDELDEFEKHYDKWIINMSKRSTKKTTK